MKEPDISWTDLLRAYWGRDFNPTIPNGEHIIAITDRAVTVIAFRGCAPVFPEAEGKPAAPALRLLPGEAS